MLLIRSGQFGQPDRRTFGPSHLGGEVETVPLLRDRLGIGSRLQQDIHGVRERSPLVVFPFFGHRRIDEIFDLRIGRKIPVNASHLEIGSLVPAIDRNPCPQHAELAAEEFTGQRSRQQRFARRGQHIVRAFHHLGREQPGEAGGCPHGDLEESGFGTVPIDRHVAFGEVGPDDAVIFDGRRIVPECRAERTRYDRDVPQLARIDFDPVDTAGVPVEFVERVFVTNLHQDQDECGEGHAQPQDIERRCHFEPAQSGQKISENRFHFDKNKV